MTRMTVTDPRRLALALAVTSLAALIVGAPVLGASPSTKRVSVSSAGVQTDDDSGYPQISGNGRYVVFTGESDLLSPADKNGDWDIYLRDRKAGKTEWISRGRAGTVNDDISTKPAISADGRFVVFESSASNLVAGDLLGHRDVFLRDRETGKTRRISRGIGGAEADGRSSKAAISASGRFIVFESEAGNLVPGVATPWGNIFLFDRVTGKTRLVSRGTDGTGAGGEEPSVSDDGRYVVFWSSGAQAHVEGAVNDGLSHIFVRDMVAKQTKMVDAVGGGAGNSHAGSPVISGDGRFIAFDSHASNLGADGMPGGYDVFVANRVTGAITLVSRGLGGAVPGDQSVGSSISADGRFIAFHSWAPNLVSGDGNDRADAFVFDRKTKKTTRVSVRTNGSEILFGSSTPAISGDGRFVAFKGWGPFVKSDTNDVDDIYVRGPLR
jgi:Tol biopolymer transport system component